MRDRGSASVLLLALGVLLVSAGLSGAAIGAARVGRHEARTAADLGALAGAPHAIEGRSVACAEAARYVTANNGVLIGCEVRDLDLIVTVEVESIVGRSRAAARAGPIDPVVVSANRPGRRGRTTPSRAPP